MWNCSFTQSTYTVHSINYYVAHDTPRLYTSIRKKSLRITQRIKRFALAYYALRTVFIYISGGGKI